MDFVQRFQQIQLHRDTSDELIKDLLIYSERVETGLRQENQRLLSQLNDAQLDLADATKSRRDLQQQLQTLETRLTTVTLENQHVKSHNPYVIVLIDGDGLLFKDHYIKQGLEGGKKAAYALRAAILSQCGDHADEIEVIAKVCANLTGLCKAMRRDGSLENESDLKDFTLGFSQGKASFDFVDVGFGKERADTKIKETTKWNLRNFNCKQIILGISHDAGYAPFLDEVLRDDSTRRRITVIEGFPTVRELVSTGVHILNLNDTLFRAEKLVDRTPRNPTPPQPFPPPVSSPVAPLAPIGPPPPSAPPAAVTSPPASTPVVAPASYARVIKSASPPPQMSLPLQPKPATTPVRQAAQISKPPPWNPGSRGVDPPIQVSQAALDSIKKRKDSNKLCNNHYLRGPCAKGDSCCFEHKYKPTADEINAIAFLARLNPCTNGQECDVEDCIYGHHCPSVRDGHCTHPYCKFGVNDHPPNTVLRKNKSYDNY